MNKDQIHQYMLRCIELANTPTEVHRPHVGAIIVNNGKIVGEGYRNFISGTKMLIHAERVALEQAVYETAGATLITTLEPCLQTNKKVILKSCSELIVETGIKKVIYGISDHSIRFKDHAPTNYLKNRGIEVQAYHGLKEVIARTLMSRRFNSETGRKL
jgi:diaminohydroxyphosphoribosylaminopyrimidine deaminase / 5-amino-6-(5-phosphoribosylamino)uracil reductase